MVQFLEVTERDTNATMIIALRFVRCIERDLRGAVVFLDGEEDGIHCQETYEEVKTALSRLEARGPA